MNKTDQIQQRTDWLKKVNAHRNTHFQINRWAYDGEFDKIMGYYDSPGFGGLDNRKRRNAKLQSWNLMKPVVDFTVTQLSRMPTIIVPSAKPGDEMSKTHASNVEQFIYWNWDQSFMNMRHLEAGFGLGCYGNAVHQLVPDMERELVVFRERDPSHCYPMPSGDGQTYEWVSFAWSEESEALLIRYPELEKVLPRKGNRYDRIVDVIEYMDKDDYGFVIQGQYMTGLPGYTHKMGIVPVTITPTMKMPGSTSPFGPCDIDQLIAINMLMNSLQTKVYDAMEENLYPTTFVFGDEEHMIDRGPGAYNFMGPSTTSDVKRLDPISIPNEVWTQMEGFKDFIRTHANWSEVWSGQLSQSQASGSAVRRLQGPALGMAGIRQSLLGEDLKLMNRYWLQMYEHFFPEKKYDCYSDATISATSAPRRPTNFSLEIVPKKDIAGYYRNSLEYSIFGSDLNSTLVAVQQLLAMDLVDEEWAMSQIPGITDEQGMKIRVDAGKMKKVELEATLQAKLEEIKTQGVIKQQQAMVDAQAQMQAAQQGGAAGGAPGQQTPGVPGNVTTLPQGSPMVMGVGEPLSGRENFPLDFENIKPFGQALNSLGGQPPAASPQEPPGRSPALPEATGITKDAEPTAVTVDEIVQAIKGIAERIASGEIRSRSGGLKGDVYLLGDLAKRGQTMGNIEIGVTVSADGQLITNALAQYRGRMTVNVLTGALPAGRGLLIVEGGQSVVPGEAETA